MLKLVIFLAYFAELTDIMHSMLKFLCTVQLRVTSLTVCN